jgi:hypothetical protein
MPAVTSMSDLDIAYQEIVAEYVESNFTSAAEKRIWDEIGVHHYDLADELTDVYQFEAVLYSIENKKIPHDNPTWQRLVVSIAYNLIHDSDWAEYYLAHTTRSIEEVQKAIDLAMFTVMAHKNFKLAGFETIQ